MNSKGNGIFILSLLSKCFEKNGTEILIVKDNDNNSEKLELISLQLLFPLLQEKKYEILFDFGEVENLKILSDKDTSIEFLRYWKNIIAKNLEINPENLIFTDLHLGSVGVHAVSLEKVDGKKIKSLEQLKEIKKIEKNQ